LVGGHGGSVEGEAHLRAGRE